MKVTQIGEFGLISLISEMITRDNSSAEGQADKDLLIGIGDDVAAWKSRGLVQLATTDCMIQDIHFNLAYTGWEDLGYKAMAVNLSDIAAMGGIPQYALVSMSLTHETLVENVTYMYQGMINIANRHAVRIVGGNISAADKIILNVSIHGYLQEKNMMMRSAAKPGDQVAITGYTGLSIAGMKMLQNKMNIEGEAASLFRKAHLLPEPRIREGQQLLSHGVKAAIDISDGLMADLKHICIASSVSAKIRSDLIPIHPLLNKHFKDNALEMALSGGEDYELLFTAEPKIIHKIKRDFHCPINVIGEIGIFPPGRIEAVDETGANMALISEGWEHFKGKIIIE